MIDALEWTLPMAGWSLLLPLVVLALSFRRERTRAVPLGTFALWQRLAVSAGEERRRRVTPARWLWIAALCAACLALAGPRVKSAETLATLTVVVDRDITMHMEHTAPDGSPSGRGTRLDSALADLRELFLHPALEGFDQARIVWRTRAADGDSQVGEFPDRWRGPGETQPGEAQPWSRFDGGALLWLTDSLDAVPEQAGWIQSGGGPVFGIAAQDGPLRYHWDGENLTEEGTRAQPLTIWVDDKLPPALRSLAREWAGVRGHVLDPALAPVDATGLRIHAVVPVASGEANAARGSRDGWTIDGPVARTPARTDKGLTLQTWLEAVHEQATVPVVSWRKGVIHVGLGAGVPHGDPAAFAVSWSRLLDGACRSGPGVLSVALRQAVGASSSRAPQLPTSTMTGGAGAPARRPIGAWLACAAALLAGIALSLGGAGLR
ncbi:MAG: hypothetical protein ACI8QZ_001498 [Chlamydiales bacterium]|jgi:hypothetical protein